MCEIRPGLSLQSKLQQILDYSGLLSFGSYTILNSMKPFQYLKVLVEINGIPRDSFILEESHGNT